MNFFVIIPGGFSIAILFISARANSIKKSIASFCVPLLYFIFQ